MYRVKLYLKSGAVVKFKAKEVTLTKWTLLRVENTEGRKETLAGVRLDEIDAITWKKTWF